MKTIGTVVAASGDHGDLPLNQVRCQRWKLITMILCPAVFDRDVLTFHIADFIQALSEGWPLAKRRTPATRRRGSRSPASPAVPMLKQLIEGETRETISLRNRVVIAIHTASFRSTRGYTVVACLLDEVAYWPVDENAAEPDIEVVNAIRPALAAVPDAMLLAASSPHSRRGALWDAHRKHFGKDGDPILVWQAATRDMNASVPQSYIDAHMADDPARAAAEYGAIFRSDVMGFVALEVVEGCVGGHREMLPAAGNIYRCFVDPAGGSGEDSFKPPPWGDTYSKKKSREKCP